MQRKLRLAYFAHTLRSDWNNGNAHFLRGLLRSLRTLGHEVTAFEPATAWSIDNLRSEVSGEQSLQQFVETYAELDVQTYDAAEIEAALTGQDHLWRQRLRGTHVVILHEWNPPELAALLLGLRQELGFTLLFHDTHHRASSSPESFARLGLERFDGVLAFGEALRSVYQERFHLDKVWTLHEGADRTVFHPMVGVPAAEPIVWVGNWGEGERSREIHEYLLGPAAALQPAFHTRIFGVRYPADGRAALDEAGVAYGGYLPNLEAPRVYASARLTVHIPRQQYSAVMTGIPTIRVFEALACGVPLVSAPWQDSEQLFRPGDFLMAESPRTMLDGMTRLLQNPALAEDQAAQGRETVLARHTCDHRARELTDILEGLHA